MNCYSFLCRNSKIVTQMIKNESTNELRQWVIWIYWDSGAHTIHFICTQCNILTLKKHGSQDRYVLAQCQTQCEGHREQEMVVTKCLRSSLSCAARQVALALALAFAPLLHLQVIDCIFSGCLRHVYLFVVSGNKKHKDQWSHVAKQLIS